MRENRRRSWARARRVAATAGTNGLGLAGLAGFTFGVYLHSVPAAWMTGGGLAVVVAVILELDRRRAG